MESAARTPPGVLDRVHERILVLEVPSLAIRYANRAFLEQAGLSLDDILGKRCTELTRHAAWECVKESVACAARKAADRGAAESLSVVPARGKGTEPEIEIIAHPLRGPAGTITHVLEILREAGPSLPRDAGPLRSAEFLESILQASPDGIVANDRSGNIFLFNSGAERIFGYSREEVVGRMDVSRLYPAGQAREVREYIHSEQYGGRGRLVDFETTVLSRDGRRIPIRLSCALLYDRGREIGTVGFFQDISAGKEVLQRMRESADRFRGIVESARDGILTIGEDRVIRMANRAAEEMLGYGPGELEGMEIGRLLPAAYAENWEMVTRYALSGRDWSEKKYVEIAALRKSGESVPVHISLSETRVTGQPAVLTAILRDISDWKSQEEELRLLSITDPLTRLYNRRHFQSLAQREIERTLRKKTPFSVLMIDIDHFKSYNDRYGHPEGDKLLQETGDLIRSCFRSMDSGFRFGGEEFVVLLPETDSFGAMVSAERFRILFSDRERTPGPDRRPVRVTASIGIAEFREGGDLDDLVRRADLAMYAAKNRGRNRCVTHDSLVEGFQARPSPE
ncbi:MAG: hypothetical protein Kow00128_22440 [Deltaproteobacteria bacterium]